VGFHCIEDFADRRFLEWGLGINPTEMRQDKAETKRSETRHNRNETKPNKSSINKKTKQTLTKRFFLHETTIHKMPVAW
jgi:hypothetical protein